WSRRGPVCAWQPPGLIGVFLRREHLDPRHYWRARLALPAQGHQIRGRGRAQEVPRRPFRLDGDTLRGILVARRFDTGPDPAPPQGADVRAPGDAHGNGYAGRYAQIACR